MIPSDPTSSGPGPLLQHLTTLQNDFRQFDTAKQGAGAKPDNIVSKDDLRAVVKDGGKSGRFSQADVQAAQFFLDHPEALARVDTAAVSDNEPGVHEVSDDRLGQLDVQAALRDARDFDGSMTIGTQQPAVPADHPDEAQQDAEMLLRLDDQPAAGTNVDPNVEFTQMLQRHQGDTAYLHDFFGALGSNGTGRALFDALRTPGPSRIEARGAIDALQSAGLLNDKDLAAAQFKTSPGASGALSLKTLLGADSIERQVEARRAKMASATDAKDTTAFSAYDALLTVDSPANKSFIQATAAKYGIDPALLAGTTASEMDFDLGEGAKLADGAWRNLWWVVEPFKHNSHLQGPGIASVHHDSLVWAVDYLKANGDPSASAAQAFLAGDPDRRKSADFQQSVEAAAIYLKALTDVRNKGGASNSSPQDMAVIWDAYRTGVKGLTPSGKGYTMDEFLANHVDQAGADKLVQVTGDPTAAAGGNAYQSEPYFDYLMRS